MTTEIKSLLSKEIDGNPGLSNSALARMVASTVTAASSYTVGTLKNYIGKIKKENSQENPLTKEEVFIKEKNPFSKEKGYEILVVDNKLTLDEDMLSSYLYECENAYLGVYLFGEGVISTGAWTTQEIIAELTREKDGSYLSRSLYDGVMTAINNMLTVPNIEEANINVTIMTSGVDTNSETKVDDMNFILDILLKRYSINLNVIYCTREADMGAHSASDNVDGICEDLCIDPTNACYGDDMESLMARMVEARAFYERSKIAGFNYFLQ